jgi:flagellar hook-associated protein 1 FlgK
MSSFSTLEIGKRALIAQRLGLDVTSNNVANVNTPGFSRRQIALSETAPTLTPNGYIGTGTVMDKLRSFREEFFDKEIRKNISRNQGFGTDGKIMKQIEGIMNEPNGTTLGNAVSDFFNSFEDISVRPQDISLRRNLIDKAKTLVDYFHNLSSGMKDMRLNILSDMKNNVTAANDLIKQIATLNNKIAISKAQGGTEAATLVDQRELLLEDLSTKVDITVSQGEGGMENIFINGINVITGKDFSKLQVVEKMDTTTGEKTVSLYNLQPDGTPLYALNPQSGEIASQMKHFNVTLDGEDSSGGYSMMKALDSFANSFVQRVNSITVTGYGLNDTGPLPPGRSFFSPIMGTANASNIDISSDILNSPENITLSDTLNEPGNNKIALLISALSQDSTFASSMTPSGYYGSIVGKLGTISAEAINGGSTTNLIAQQLQNQRESVIGVNLDEEAVNLIKYQKAFEASSRIVNTTNELLGIIVNLGR